MAAPPTATPLLPPGGRAKFVLAEDFSRTRVHLLEASEEVLAEILRDGVVIKGGPEEEAVLCTERTTYLLRLVETSNSLLLVPPARAPRVRGMFYATHAHVQSGAAQRAAVPSEPPGGGGGAAGSAEGEPELTVTAACLASSHLELVEVAPPLRTLAALLAAAPFGEAAAERAPGAPAWGYTWEELWARVQCSRAQLQAGLRAQRAACLRGRWCLLQPAYQTTLLDVLLLTAGAQGWPLSAFDSNAMVAAVAADGFDAEAARHVLSLFAGPCQAGPGPAGDGLWAVDAPALCRARAQTLLAAAERRRCDEFMAAWRASLPDGVEPSLELLRGEALVEQSGLETWVSAFPLSQLPRTPRERFAALFARKPRWTREEITPYLAEVEEAGATEDGLLLAWCRRSQPRKEDPETFSTRFL